MRLQKDKIDILRRVGLQIRDCRLKAGIKQDQIEEFGVIWKHFQKIESGKTGL